MLEHKVNVCIFLTYVTDYLLIVFEESEIVTVSVFNKYTEFFVLVSKSFSNNTGN